ncbi:MAG: hypothetical protein VZQ84_04370 [Anaerovoracaceae bacterium]|nr:hypothetical protein [Anaerovoracaceae bacterium]
MRTDTKGGYYIVEAAIFLPLFIIGVLTIGCFVNVIAATENIIFAGCDEARYCAQEAYVHNTAPELRIMLARRIQKENHDLEKASVRGMRYRYGAYGISDLITFDVDYAVRVNLPVKMRESQSRNVTITCRAFVGAGPENDPMGFAAMERDEDARTVYVFPHGGECFHKKSCTFVSSKPVQVTLSSSIRKKYEPCHLCRPSSLSNGSNVYCFMNYGETYHRKSCSCIDKYIIPMEKSEAEGRGYRKCSKCGGV